MLAIATKNSQRLTRLINDLLDMEKLLFGEMIFDQRRQPLLPLVEEALESLEASAAEHGVALALADKVPPATEVYVDRDRLLQALGNLISNAIKFSPPQGTVEISIDSIGSRLRVTVRDHGPGVPAGFRERIFQKFAQADSSASRQKGGTGLGLAITRELIERMGGEVGFESMEGQGASFYFDLPTADPA
jgi:signal transduction histidine kinase